MAIYSQRSVIANSTGDPNCHPYCCRGDGWCLYGAKDRQLTVVCGRHFDRRLRGFMEWLSCDVESLPRAPR